jgi:protoheme IX farnesyltransferase
MRKSGGLVSPLTIFSRCKYLLFESQPHTPRSSVLFSNHRTAAPLSSHKVKPSAAATQPTPVPQTTAPKELETSKLRKYFQLKLGRINKSPTVQQIDTQIDTKRKEIGFSTESLLDSSWKEIKIDYKNLPLFYSKLAKKNLTALVVCTTVMGCVMTPVPVDVFTLAVTTLGTTLTSSAANTFNQFLEVPYDSQMNRTKDRVLVRGQLTPLHAFTFATLCGTVGVSVLYIFVNPLTAALGASTLLLYTGVYTPMKRLSPVNTWVGSVVGAIPPLMGWTAMTGHVDTAGLLLAAILYSWQFPHFHALSWNLRSEYSRAGYRMISVLNPRICTSSALSHTVALLVMCSLIAPLVELTTWNFAIDSLPFNLYFIYLAVRFKRDGDAQSSRRLFRYSLLYLPFVILLMLITKYPSSEQKRQFDIRTDIVDAGGETTADYLSSIQSINNKFKVNNKVS